jgi:hypothetical protein
VKCKLDSGKDHTSSRLRERRRAAPSPFSNQVTPVDMVSRAETYDKLPPAHLPSSDARDFKRPSLSLAIACLWVKTGRRPGDPNHTRPLSIACSRRYHRGSVNPKSVRGICVVADFSRMPVARFSKNGFLSGNEAVSFA